jgi:hypothetical protein
MRHPDPGHTRQESKRDEAGEGRARQDGFGATPASARRGRMIRPVRRWQKKKTGLIEPTPLSIFVSERLAELDLRQSEFCRLNGFDQGLLSRIQNSMAINLSLESALRLALGLSVPPKSIFNLIDRMDLHQLIIGAYAAESFEMSESNQQPEITIGARDKQPE